MYSEFIYSQEVLTSTKFQALDKEHPENKRKKLITHKNATFLQKYTSSHGVKAEDIYRNRLESAALQPL